MRISDWSSDVCSSDLTLCVGDAASAAEEVGIERRVVLVRLMDVAAGGVGLPDLDQRVGLRAPRLVEHVAGDDDALANGLSGGLPFFAAVPGQVVVERPEAVLPEHRAGPLGKRLTARATPLRGAAEPPRLGVGADEWG